MAQVMLTFGAPVTDGSGAYHARVVGRRAEDGMWEGWLEFEPLAGPGETLVGAVESRQPEREHLEYWASGLTPVYLEGSLARARHPIVVRARVVEEAFSEAPAPSTVVVPTDTRVYYRESVLDPFEVAEKSGLDLLDQELRAFNRPRLLNIIGDFNLNPSGESVEWMTDAQLVRFIVVAVEAQLLNRVRR